MATGGPDMSTSTDNIQDRYEGGRVDWGHHRERSRVERSVSLGSSLRGSSLSTLMSNHKNYSIVCGIELQNWTKYELAEPVCEVKHGYVSTPPVTIKPGQKEAMITHKNEYSMRGSCGIVSWLVKPNCRRVIVLWSSPYFSSNRLAVGITNGITTHEKKSWFDSIWKRKDIQDLHYTMQMFNQVLGEIKVEDDSFQVLGSMGNSSKPEIKIIFRPLHRNDLSIRS